jgi:RNA polymerase sigma-32 factor
MNAFPGWASGCLATLANRLPYLTPDEERDLALRSAAGDQAAAERLVASHLRVVVKIARSYGRFGLPVNELIQEGTVGLIQAVRKFNPDSGARLGTYAMWWIRAAIQDYVVRSWSLVRVGKTAAHKALFFALKKVAAEQRKSSAALNEDALSVLATRFELPQAEVSGLAKRIAHFDQSLDAPLRDAEGAETTAAQEIRDWSATPDEDLVNDETRVAMEKAIAELPDDWRVAFMLRDVEEMSNADAAATLDLSVPAFKARVHRARLFLRDRLDRHFGTTSRTA